MSPVFLGLGANMGDRLATLQRAADLLADHGVRAVASSRVWATAPVGGPPDQPEFLNAVIEVDVDGLEPADVLEAAHNVEDELGRVRKERWGPRTIDVDVLLWGTHTSGDPDLTIPHPRMTERAFVVLPLLDVDPDPRLPDGRRVVELPAPDGEVRPFAPPLALPR
jgi:2-amino-4-hydroxy-6-hydroxymethyldihydropteridine diphosphokinase